MEEYMNISTFLIGVSTTFFATLAIYILFWRKDRTRFQTVLGWIMTIWTLSNLKDIILTFPEMYTQHVLDWIMMIDGWVALTYTVLVFEVVIPRWTTLFRLSMQAMPFAVFTLLYIIWPVQEVIYSYLVFLWCYAWTVVGIGWMKARRHIRYVRENFSNIDRIDVAWLKPVFFFSIVSQLMWLFASLYGTVATDIVYYVSSLALWLIVLHYSWNFRPINVEKEKEAAADMFVPKNALPICEEEL